MRKTIVTLGSALILSTASLAGAAPASASEADICSNPTVGIVCDAARRQLDHVKGELAQVPGYVATAQQKVLEAYDYATYTVRCIISGTC